ETTALRDLLRIAWRRKLIILQAAIIIPAIAVVLAMRKPALYSASASILITDQNQAAQLARLPDLSQSTDASHFSANETFLASSPAVARAAVAAAAKQGVKLPPGAFLSMSSVAASSTADVLHFGVVNGDPVVAVELANDYAQAFTDYTTSVNTNAA